MLMSSVRSSSCCKDKYTSAKPASDMAGFAGAFKPSHCSPQASSNHPFSITQPLSWICCKPLLLPAQHPQSFFNHPIFCRCARHWREYALPLLWEEATCGLEEMYSGIRSALQAETASAEATRPSTVPQHCVEQQNDPAYGQKGPRSVCILPAFQYILIGTRQVKRHNVKPLFLRIHNCDEKPKQPQLRNFALHRPSVQYIEIMLYKQIATLSEPQHLSNPRAGCCLKSSTLPCSFPPSGASFSCLPMIPWTGRKNAAPRQFWTAFCPNCIRGASSSATTTGTKSKNICPHCSRLQPLKDMSS